MPPHRSLVCPAWEARCRLGDQFGMRSFAGKANIAARTPNLGSDPFGWTCLNHSRKIPARDARQRCLPRRSGDILDVARIDRSRHDPHQRRLLIGSRGRDFRHLKNLGIAEGLEPYRVHDLLLRVVIRHSLPAFSVSGGVSQHFVPGRGTRTLDAVAKVLSEFDASGHSLVAIARHRDLCDSADRQERPEREAILFAAMDRPLI
jgi:hypothetical protein